MSPKDDGGPAFPRPNTGPDYPGQQGMTLRDYFAGQALAGFLANDMDAEYAVTQAYQLADTMLKARST